VGSATFTVTATNSAGTDSKAYTIVTTAAAITKTAAAAPVLPSTGFDVLPWGVGGVLTLLVGAVLLVRYSLWLMFSLRSNETTSY
jgi:hypothetical protein